MNELCSLVTPEGFLFITAPNAVNIRKRLDVLNGKTNLPSYEPFYWSFSPWRGHIRKYVKNDLELLSKYLNLNIIKLEGCHHMLQKVSKKILPLYCFATIFFKGWRDSWVLVAQKPTDWKPLKWYLEI